MNQKPVDDIPSESELKITNTLLKNPSPSKGLAKAVAKPADDKELDEILGLFNVPDAFPPHSGRPHPNKEVAKKALNAHYQKKYEKVDRFEVIDETGRAYVKGSIYGSSIKVELSLQDDGRTLKVFMEALANIKSEAGEQL